jgi:hypothetical protein
MIVASVAVLPATAFAEKAITNEVTFTYSINKKQFTTAQTNGGFIYYLDGGSPECGETDFKFSHHTEGCTSSGGPLMYWNETSQTWKKVKDNQDKLDADKEYAIRFEFNICGKHDFPKEVKAHTSDNRAKPADLPDFPIYVNGEQLTDEKAEIYYEVVNDKLPYLYVTVPIGSPEVYVAKPTVIKTKKNSLTAKGKTVKVKYKKLKKKSQKIQYYKAIEISKSEGAWSFKKVKGNKKITVNKETGKITLKKGLKKGTYKVKVKVTASGGKIGNTKYKKGSKTVTVKIIVK